MIDSLWEAKFALWASPPSQSEQALCDNAIAAIKVAVQNSAALSAIKVKVFVQGSYRNRVNVRSDSDVDVGVMCHEYFLSQYPPNKSHSDFGNYSAGYTFLEFKNELEIALVSHFGANAVKRGNKAFEIDENTYRINADVVPLFEFRQFWDNGSYRAGVALIPDKGSRIENYPERLFGHWPNTPLHYENGVSKNDLTSRAYKGVARIVKCLVSDMEKAGFKSAESIPGYLCECLAYNCPNVTFGGTSWREKVENVVEHIWLSTYSAEACKAWTEVDAIKFLFHNSQPWNQQEVFSFITDIRTHLGIS